MKPRRVPLPRTEYVRSGLRFNPDGAGYMLAHSDTVYIRKGFWTAEALWASMDGLGKDLGIDLQDVPLVIHARLGTSGGRCVENTHPFPVSSSPAALRALSVETEMGVAHNGILGTGEGNLSDTMVFIRDTLSMFAYDDMRSTRGKVFIENLLSGDRMVVLHKSGDYTLWGAWVEDDDGCLWSNRSYTYETVFGPSRSKVRQERIGWCERCNTWGVLRWDSAADAWHCHRCTDPDPLSKTPPLREARAMLVLSKAKRKRLARHAGRLGRCLVCNSKDWMLDDPCGDKLCPKCIIEFWQ